MNKEAVKAWVADLKSGEFTQGTNHLKNTANTYCCLGVLVRTFEKVHKLKFDTEISSTGKIAFADMTYTPPQMVLDWVGISNDDVDLLMHLNDTHNCSFEGIARVIERISQE